MSKELEALRKIKRFDGNMSREQNQRYAELEEALMELEELKQEVIARQETENSLTHRTAREKLIEMGYDEFTRDPNYTTYRHDELPKVTIYIDKSYSCGDTNLELSRILTQYLEELE